MKHKMEHGLKAYAICNSLGLLISPVTSVCQKEGHISGEYIRWGNDDQLQKHAQANSFICNFPYVCTVFKPAAFIFIKRSFQYIRGILK